MWKNNNYPCSDDAPVDVGKNRTRPSVWSNFGLGVLALVFLMSLATPAQAQECLTDYYDPKNPTDGICGGGCPGTASCAVKGGKNVCSCSGGGDFVYQRPQSDNKTGILSVCNSNGFEKDTVCPPDSCAKDTKPLKCQAKYYNASEGTSLDKPPVDYCLCAPSTIEFFRKAFAKGFTNNKEYNESKIGDCVLACPLTENKLETAIIPDPKVLDFVPACPCEQKVGGLQNHTYLKYDSSAFASFNTTYYTIAVCGPSDLSCKGTCPGLALGPNYVTPYRCITLSYTTFGARLLPNEGSFGQSFFCACGGPAEPVPKFRTPSGGAGSIEADEQSSPFPRILSRLYKALKYVRSYFRRNGRN